MKPVFQTKFGKGVGNCFQAAIASLLELPFNEVPDFCNLFEEGEYYYQFTKWLHTKGMSAVCLGWSVMSVKDYFRKTLYLGNGINDKGVRHCVVYYGLKQVHNPNPNSPLEIIKPDMMDVIFPIDPADTYKYIKDMKLKQRMKCTKHGENIAAQLLPR